MVIGRACKNILSKIKVGSELMEVKSFFQSEQHYVQPHSLHQGPLLLMSACPSEKDLYLRRNDDSITYRTSLKRVSDYQQRECKMYFHHNITDLGRPSTLSYNVTYILQTYNLTELV